MCDLKNGEIKIGDVILSSDTPIEDLLNSKCFKHYLEYKPNVSVFSFNAEKVDIEGSTFNVHVMYYEGKIDYIRLRPLNLKMKNLGYPDKCYQKVCREECDRFLWEQLGDPTSFDEKHTKYIYSWGVIYSVSIYEDRREEYTGGFIRIDYKDEDVWIDKSKFKMELEVVRNALAKGEIKYVLAGDEEYLKSIGVDKLFEPSGRLYAIPPEYLDPIDIHSVLNVIVDCYYQTEKNIDVRKAFQDKLAHSLLEMVNDSNTDSLYYATRVYCIIAWVCDNTGHHPFKNILKDLKQPLENNLKKNKDILITEKGYNGKNFDNGRWGAIMFTNEDLSSKFKLNI